MWNLRKKCISELEPSPGIVEPVAKLGREGVHNLLVDQIERTRPKVGPVKIRRAKIVLREEQRYPSTLFQENPPFLTRKNTTVVLVIIVQPKLNTYAISINIEKLFHVSVYFPWSMYRKKILILYDKFCMKLHLNDVGCWAHIDILFALKNHCGTSNYP